MGSEKTESLSVLVSITVGYKLSSELGFDLDWCSPLNPKPVSRVG